MFQTGSYQGSPGLRFPIPMLSTDILRDAGMYSAVHADLRLAPI